jgi:hypothetical protein
LGLAVLEAKRALGLGAQLPGSNIVFDGVQHRDTAQTLRHGLWLDGLRFD